MVDQKRPNLSVVIPVYNGGLTIENLVQQVFDNREGHHIEFVLINDGSVDNSADVCRAMFNSGKYNLIFIDLNRNFGEHNALITGLRYATGDYIVTMDDDLQNPPQEVLKLYEYTKNNNFDVTYSYYEQKADAAWRNIGSKIANKTADYVLDKPKNLYLSSFRCMSRFVAQQVCEYVGPFPYVDGLIFQVTQNVSQLQVEHHPRIHHKSNYTITRLLRLWLSIFINFSVKPLRIATLLGLSMSCVGLLGSSIVLAEYFYTGIEVQGWASLMLVVLIFSGVQLTIMGLMGEYIGRMYMTITQKPQSIIRTILSPGSKS